MPLDGIATHFLAQELRTALVNGRLGKITQMGRYDLAFTFRKDQQNRTLLLSANPSSPIAYLAEKPRGGLKEAPSFCMLLRKHLSGALLTDIDHPEGERLLRFAFRARNELGDWVSFTLVAELMGKHSNLLLLNESGVILDCIRHIDHSVNRLREMMPARLYVNPPLQEKLLLSELSISGRDIISSMKSLLLSKDTQEKIPANLVQQLVSCLAGCSPTLARELCFRSHLPEATSLFSLTEQESFELQKAIRSLAQQVQETKAAPALYSRSADEDFPDDFYPLTLITLPLLRKTGSFSQAIELFFKARGDRALFDEQSRQIEKQLHQWQKQIQRKMDLHQRDWDEGNRAEDYRLKGELLQQKVYSLKEKLPQVTVQNYYEEGAPDLVIELDPTLSPAKNVDRYFWRYRKAKDKKQYAEGFLEKDHQDSQWIGSLYSSLEQAESLEDLEAIQRELQHILRQSSSSPVGSNEIPKNQQLNPGKPASGKRKKNTQYLQSKPSKKPAQTADTATPFRRFKTSEGLEIFCGRNNLENDRLTFRTARKSDWWFHVRNMPGSHVVLMANGQEPSEEALEKAATVAAWYSSGNRSHGGEKIAVDYCPIGHVTKIHGAKPGLVTYRDFQTAIVVARHPKEFLEIISD